MLFRSSALLIKIAHARETAAAQKKDNIYQVNVAADDIRWVTKNRLPSSSSPILWFQIAAQQASQNMLNDFTHRSVRVRNELVSESYFRSLIYGWWEGFEEDKECWWGKRQVEVAKLIYQKVGCQPPVPYSIAAKSLNQFLEIWFKSEKQQHERLWVVTKTRPRLP